MPSKKITSEKLKSVKPSGKKDESFFEMVFEVARQIPRGKSDIVRCNCCSIWNKNVCTNGGMGHEWFYRVRPKVPAHRVVNRNGMLSGKMHFDYPEKMQELLEKDGVTVVDDKVVDFEKEVLGSNERVVNSIN